MTALFPAWADGSNYDISQLELYTAVPGFILGEGILGESLLGGDGPEIFRPMYITSCVVNQPCVVEDGLFVHREVESCVMTGTQPLAGPMGWKGQRIKIRYGPKILFAGTVNEVSLTESVDIDGSLPGNQANRTHRLTLRATNSTEGLALTQTPPRDWDSTTNVWQRLQSYMGLPTLGGDLGPDEDVDSGVMENLAWDISSRWRVQTTDQFGTLVETFRDLLRRINRYYRFERGAGRVDTESISRPASGGTTLDSALRFTDDNSLVDPGDAAYDGKTSVGRTVSYSQLVRSEDPSMFATGATVTIGSIIEGPLTIAASVGGVVDRNDVEINLGNVDYNSRRGQAARNFIGTLPLRRRPELFVSSISAPLQSEHQVQNRVPGLATLNREGVDELVAIIGITHTITPYRWLVEYDCAPVHLLTRESDWDPSPVTDLRVHAVTGSGPYSVELRCNSPRSIPDDTTFYLNVYTQTGVNDGGEVPSDSNHTTLIYNAVPSTEDTLVAATVSLPAGLHTVGVQYTNCPPSEVAAGGFASLWRTGQPRKITFTIP